MANMEVALATAAFTGSMESVSRLLGQGADINAVGGEYGTALAVASFRGSTDIVSLLLDRGADINAVGGEYGTALAAAAYHCNTDIVSLLLDRGADINAAGGRYGTALAAAAFCRSTDTTAASCGSIDTVSLLLGRGANINAVGGEYGTALGAAVFGRRKDMVSLLVDQGADMNLVTSKFGTVLGQAIYNWSTESALILLEHGADVMHVGGSYSTASGVYPSALDVAHSEGSRADPALLALLEMAIEKYHGSGDQSSNPGVNPVDIDDVISRPPFPMPYTGLYSGPFAGHYKCTAPSNLSAFDILSTELHSDGNISSDLAKVSCRELNKEVLWRSLAAFIGLNEDTVQSKYQWIQNDIHYFISCNFDYGLAYAAARVAWKHFNEHSMDSNVISVQRSWWRKHAQGLYEARLMAIEISHPGSEQEVIISPYSIMPRRLWDLKSNRVVNFHLIQSTIKTPPTFWAVLHNQIVNYWPHILTAINQHQWPIPLPKSISLDHLRSELLTLGAEYIWIDVICLRQQSGNDYQLQYDEWKLDIPTTGNIYRAAAKIVCYFNGLGIPFGNEDWDRPRHWLWRAWTPQEIEDEKTIINGGTPQGQGQGQVFVNSQGKVLDRAIKSRDGIRPVMQLTAQVDSLHGCEIYELMREVAKGYASNPVNNILELLYLLRTTKLPCYSEHKYCEDFWAQCFHLLPFERKAEILFNFPYRGSQWFPSWEQMRAWPVRDPGYDHMRFQSPLNSMRNIPWQNSFFISNIWIIPHAVLLKTKRTGRYNGKIRNRLFGSNAAKNSSEYEVQINNRVFGFFLPYLSQELIDEQDQPVFTLAAAELGHAHNWVVCRAMENDLGVAEVNVLKKVGVIRMDFRGELFDGAEHGVSSLLQKMDCLFV